MSTLICFATLENDLPPWPISTKIYLPQDKGGVTICTLAIPKYTLSIKDKTHETQGAKTTPRTYKESIKNPRNSKEF